MYVVVEHTNIDEHIPGSVGRNFSEPPTCHCMSQLIGHFSISLSPFLLSLAFFQTIKS